MYFEAQTGKITGEGVSVWQGESVPFEIVGAFTPAFTSIELLKLHRGGSATHVRAYIDLDSKTIRGAFPNGSCYLAKVANTVQPQQPSAVGPARSISSSSGSGAGDAPKDLLTFLSVCFPDSSGTAARLHALFSENELHDAESLTQLASDDWKELGVSLGHRSKIKLHLTRFYPGLMKSDELAGGVVGGSGIVASQSPTSSVSSDAAVQPNPPYHTHPGMYGGVAQGGNHYVPVNANPYGPPRPASNGPPSFSPQPQQQQQGGFGQSVPLEFLCPITREVSTLH